MVYLYKSCEYLTTFCFEETTKSSSPLSIGVDGKVFVEAESKECMAHVINEEDGGCDSNVINNVNVFNNCTFFFFFGRWWKF